MAVPVPQWINNLVRNLTSYSGEHPPQALGYGYVPPSRSERSNQAYSARLSALSRYYGGVGQQGTMANLRRYDQMMPAQRSADVLFQQQYGMSRQDALRRYSNRQRLDYERAMRGWNATRDRYTAMALNYPMYNPPPASAPGAGGGYGGGGYGGGYGGVSPGDFGSLPEWYLAIMNWRI